MQLLLNMFRMLLVATLLFAASPAFTQSTLDIDEQRSATLEKLEAYIPDPNEIRKIAKETFAEPIADQDMDVLESLAKQANSYANMVGFIVDDYDDFRRENYRYDIVLRKLEPVRDTYVRVSNEFKDIRNQAYFNLGRL